MGRTLPDTEKYSVLTRRKVRKTQIRVDAFQIRHKSHSEAVPLIIGNYGNNDRSGEALSAPHETYSDIPYGLFEAELRELDTRIPVRDRMIPHLAWWKN